MAAWKIDSSVYSLGGHNLGAYSHFAHKREAAQLSAGNLEFAGPALWPDFDKLEGAESDWTDCSTLGVAAKVSTHMDFLILPYPIVNDRKMAARIVAEQANQNQALAQPPAPAGVTAHNPLAVSGTPLAFGHYIGVETELVPESELILQPAHALQMSLVGSRRNSWAALLSDAGGSQSAHLGTLAQKQVEQMALYKSESDKSGLAARRAVEWGPYNQAPHRTGPLARRRAFVPKLGSASLRRKASWIAPSPSPSRPKR